MQLIASGVPAQMRGRGAFAGVRDAQRHRRGPIERPEKVIGWSDCRSTDETVAHDVLGAIDNARLPFPPDGRFITGGGGEDGQGEDKPKKGGGCRVAVITVRTRFLWHPWLDGFAVRRGRRGTDWDAGKNGAMNTVKASSFLNAPGRMGR